MGVKMTHIYCLTNSVGENSRHRFTGWALWSWSHEAEVNVLAGLRFHLCARMVAVDFRILRL